MIIAPLPPNENDRLAALREYHLLDTVTEEIFDHLTALAATVCKVPISLISLVDQNRQWFKSAQGLPGVTETSRDVAFCSHTILDSQLMEINDALKDERFHDNPLVSNDPKIRFYAGMPLIDVKGFKLGTLCVIDRVPKHLNATQRKMLERMSKIIVELFELKKITINDLIEKKEASDSLLAMNTQLEQQLSIQQKNQKDMSLLSEMSNLLQTCLNAEEAFEAIYKFCHQLFSDASGALYLMDAKQHCIELVTEWGKPTILDTVFPSKDCWALRQGQPHRAINPDNDLVCQHMKNDSIMNPHICLPLTAQSETLGLLCLEFNMPNTSPKNYLIDETRYLFATTVAEQIALALASIKLHEMLHYQSVRDPLTGLFNRRYLEEIFYREILRANHIKKQFSVIMVDIDHFKRFNDTFGHDAGDAVLRELAAMLVRHTHKNNVVCRLGGEEFLLLLRDATLEESLHCAEQLRQASEKLILKFNGTALEKITLSLGVALFPDHGETPENLISAADKALYDAKNNGRNCVMLAKI